MSSCHARCVCQCLALDAPGVRPLLAGAHERTASGLLPALSRLLGGHLTVDPGPLRLTSYADFVESQPQPAHLVVMDPEPSVGSAVCAFAPPLVIRLLGQPGAGERPANWSAPRRPASARERGRVSRVARLFARHCALAWHRTPGDESPCCRYEVDSRLGLRLPPRETVLWGAFTLRFADGSGGEVDLCIPWQALRPAWLAGSAGRGSPKARP